MGTQVARVSEKFGIWKLSLMTQIYIYIYVHILHVLRGYTYAICILLLITAFKQMLQLCPYVFVMYYKLWETTAHQVGGKLHMAQVHTVHYRI